MSERPDVNADGDTIRAYLRETGWELGFDGCWHSPVEAGFHVHSVHDSRWDHDDPNIRAAGVREIGRYEEHRARKT